MIKCILFNFAFPNKMLPFQSIRWWLFTCLGGNWSQICLVIHLPYRITNNLLAFNSYLNEGLLLNRSVQKCGSIIMVIVKNYLSHNYTKTSGGSFWQNKTFLSTGYIKKFYMIHKICPNHVLWMLASKFKKAKKFSVQL